MDPTLVSLLAMAIGLFYAVGGLLLLRRLPAETVMDQMLAALGDTTAPAERARTRLWMVGGAVIFASGVSLVVLSRWAPVLFIGGAVFQLAYLAWVSRHLPAEDEASRQGRRSVVQALALYLIATGFVLWFDRQGIWREWISPAVLELLALVAVTAAVAAVLLRHAFWTAPALPFDAQLMRRGPAVVRLRPERGMPPLRDDATNEPIDPAILGLDDALMARIAAWNAAYQATFKAGSDWDLASEQAWHEEGLSIVADIQMDWIGTLRNEMSGLEMMLSEARRGLGPADATPIEVASAIAPRCGVSEIREAFDRLDRLSWEKAELPAWDGDAQDDVARTQRFLAHLLAHVPARYGPELQLGLDHAEEETRSWVTRTLDLRAGRQG